MVADELRTSPFMVRESQVAKIDELKAKRQRANRDQKSVSRSEIVRDALDAGLPVIEGELDAAAIEEQAEAVAVGAA